MFILYFALWVVLNGRWTTEIGAFGLVFAAVAYLFTCRFMGYSLSLDFALLKRAPHAVSYAVLLLREIVKANVTVAKMILNREFEPQPHLVRFDVNLKKERHRVTLANSITLTPGTITVSLDDNHYVVHCLDKSMIDGLDNGEMVCRLEKMERRHAAPAKAAAPAEETAAAEETMQAEAAAPAKETVQHEAAAMTEETKQTEAAAPADDADETTEEEKGDEHER